MSSAGSLMVTRGFVVFFSVITTNVFLTGLQFLSNPAAGSINTVEVICVVIASFLAGMFGFLAAMGQSRALALVHFIFVAILLGIQLGFGIYALVLAGDVLTPFEIFMTVLQFLITLAGCVAAGFHYALVAKAARSSVGSVALLSDVDSRM